MGLSVSDPIGGELVEDSFWMEEEELECAISLQHLQGNFKQNMHVSYTPLVGMARLGTPSSRRALMIGCSHFI